MLLDEPDAHPEILRRRQIYRVLADSAAERSSQIIAARHSEVVLTEAAARDVVVAFLGKPHRIDDRGSQLLRSLRDIGFEDYYQAEDQGWVLYLEGSTDLAILQAFAKFTGAMEETLRDLVPRVAAADPADQWWRTVKPSDEFLDRLFELFFQRLDLPNMMLKSN